MCCILARLFQCDTHTWLAASSISVAPARISINYNKLEWHSPLQHLAQIMPYKHVWRSDADRRGSLLLMILTEKSGIYGFGFTERR